MRFYFIRHGQSANNFLYATTGSDKGRDCDPELTDIGRRQAELLASYLCQEGLGIAYLYTSLMVRAVATAVVVSDRLGLPATAWPDLHEEGGIYLANDQGSPVGQPGKDRAYFERYYPSLQLPENIGSSGWWNRPYESLSDRPIRARRFLSHLSDRHGGTDACVAVISHGGFYNHFLSALLNIPEGGSQWFMLFNTGISRIDFYPDRTDFIFHNKTCFLPRELIT